ncbi:hypothetical protein RFI_34307 [Reticulomyxa filosa]|uniref:Uncharacterized protein n=1 Tax=Reticulomyxa filosa TaxID=46433 RepID=X6LPM9_RETFI|nr:hypothetical protein RFI_34307 [Reticulomyxa filosa]|eukprot:ETO03102.1 hypothetical protein RFI_34307 [Reticulomyxa filosa]
MVYFPGKVDILDLQFWKQFSIQVIFPLEKIFILFDYINFESSNQINCTSKLTSLFFLYLFKNQFNIHTHIHLYKNKKIGKLANKEQMETMDSEVFMHDNLWFSNALNIYHMNFFVKIAGRNNYKAGTQFQQVCPLISLSQLINPLELGHNDMAYDYIWNENFSNKMYQSKPISRQMY